MNKRPASIAFAVVFGYVLLQFIWWEVLLVRQNTMITKERENLVALRGLDPAVFEAQITRLHDRQLAQTLMIVGEGTVFLLLLLYGVSRIRKAHAREVAFNERQSNFFLSITHELKTPIAATRLQLQTMQKQSLDEAQRQQLLSAALRENDRLNVLIDNVLLAGRLDAGETAIIPVITDLSEWAEALLQRYYAPLIRSGEISIHAENGVSAAIDREAFASVLLNLVDNAVKYTGSNKRVTVSVRKEGAEAVLRVTDNGLGIDASDQPRVFDRFYRVGAETTRSARGTGLGLYIAANIARQHGGKISVQSAPGKGSTFTVTIHAAA